MAKRRHGKRSEAPTGVHNQNRVVRRQIQADPIGGRASARSAIRSLDTIAPKGPVEDRESVRRERQARLAQITDDLVRQGRALHDAAHARATAPMETTRPNLVRRSDYGSLSRTRPNTKSGMLNEPDNKRSPKDEKVRENPTCKERPSSNRGTGGSRAFIPWCKMKK